MKNKRVKNYIKKGIELAAMLDMDVYLVLNDKDQGRVSQYCSGDTQKGHFTLEKATKFLENFKQSGGQLRLFDDNDYNKVKLPTTEHSDTVDQTDYSVSQARKSHHEDTYQNSSHLLKKRNLHQMASQSQLQQQQQQ